MLALAGLDEPATDGAGVAPSAEELVTAAEIPTHEKDRRAPAITVTKKFLRTGYWRDWVWGMGLSFNDPSGGMGRGSTRVTAFEASAPYPRS